MAQCHQHSADSVRVRFLGQLSLEAVDWSTDSLHRAMRDSLDPYPTLQCWSRSQSYSHTHYADCAYASSGSLLIRPACPLCRGVAASAGDRSCHFEYSRRVYIWNSAQSLDRSVSTLFLDSPRSHHLYTTKTMSPPRRALITLTSAHAELFEGGGHTTGVFIGEALHPYNVFRAAGFEVDIASENGTWTEDWLSLQPGFMSSEERRQYDDENSDFRREMDANVKAVDVVDKDVSIQSVQARRIHTVAY
jgi:hypothetical protein